MIQNLPGIIKENNDFQQALLKQEGGIVSYLAGHLDADGIDALYEGYRAQCMKVYRDEHKWDMMEDMMVHGALGDNHIRKELAYQMALRPVLSRFPNMADAAISFIADYLNFAFEKSHTELYPINVVNDMEFYEEVIIQYIDKLFGRAHRCLWLALNEHRGKAKAEKNEAELWEEFELQKYSRVYRSGEEKLRRAVKELIDERTRGKDKGECRQICREEAKKVMKRLWSFTRLVNGDDDILELHLKENPRLYETWSSKDLEFRGASVSFIERQKKYISKEEKAWLRQDMSYMYSSRDTADGKGLSPIQECFQRYYSILEDIGSMWAVQLKEYGIEIRELEKETGCILNKSGFYVERSKAGLFGKVLMSPSPVNEQRASKSDVDRQQESVSPKDKGNKKEGDNLPEESLPPEPLPIPEGRLNTPDAQRYFRKTIEAGYMKYENGEFIWLGIPNTRGSKSQLAYFCGKVYGYKWGLLDEKSGTKGNIGTELPEDDLIKLFGVNKLCHLLHQVYSAKKVQGWRGFIDQLFV